MRGYRHASQDELDRTLDAARVWNGPREERRELFRKADRMMLEDPPWLTLYVAANVEVLQPARQGLRRLVHRAATGLPLALARVICPASISRQ